MTKYKVRYVRTAYETYEVEVEAEDEDKAQDIINQAKYGDEIKGEKLVDSYSDEIEVTDIEEVIS